MTERTLQPIRGKGETQSKGVTILYQLLYHDKGSLLTNHQFYSISYDFLKHLIFHYLFSQQVGVLMVVVVVLALLLVVA